MSVPLTKIVHSFALVLAAALSATLAGACGAEAFHLVQDGGGGRGGSGGSGGSPQVDSGLSVTDAPEDLPVQPEVDPRKGEGFACIGAADCLTGFCVDGVCCESICNTTCRSCALPSAAGKCSPIEVGTDPANECMDQGAATCGTDGMCDGAGGCRKYAVGATCAMAGCANSMLSLAGKCTAAGMCD
jgi:hypothetical protein